MTPDFLSLPLAGSHKRFPQTNAETVVNFYAERVGKEWILRSRPGYQLMGQAAGTLGGRGLHVVNDRLFAVRGNKVSEWNGSSFVAIGTLTSISGRVGISDNGDQVLFVDASSGYGFDLGSNTFRDASGFVGAFFPGGGSQAQFAAARCFTVEAGTDRFWYCDLFDPDNPLTSGVFSWPGLNYATAETYSDPIVAIGSLGKFSLMFGAASVEAWTVNLSSADPPLVPVQASSAIGISAPASLAVFGDSAYWLGGSKGGQGIVYKSAGYVPERISDNQIEELIAKMEGISDAVGYVYQERGHVFYVLSFMTGQKTLVYDLTTGLWAERAARDPSTFVISQEYGTYSAFYRGKNLVMDYRNGNVYEVSKAFTSDNGSPIFWERTFPPFPQESNSLTYYKGFELMMDLGDPEANAAPENVEFNWSGDRGKTWSQPMTRQLGAMGEYGHRQVWIGLGSNFSRNMRVRGSTKREITLREAGVRV